MKSRGNGNPTLITKKEENHRKPDCEKSWTIDRFPSFFFFMLVESRWPDSEVTDSNAEALVFLNLENTVKLKGMKKISKAKQTSTRFLIC